MDLYKILLPPTYSDLESSHKAGFLHYALIIAAVAFLLFGFLNLSWGADTLGVTLLIFSGICLIGIILNKQRYYYYAATLYSVLIFTGIFYNLVDGAALHDPGIAALPIFILVTGFLYQKDLIPLLSFISILGVVVLYTLWTFDLILLNQIPTLNRVIILSILQVITGFLAWIISSNYQNIISDLNTSEERFHKVFMASPYSISITRVADNTIVDVNEGFVNNTGYSRAELIGQTAIESGLIQDPKITEQTQDILAAQGYIRDMEIELVHKDGNKMTSLFSTGNIELKGEQHLVTVGMDVTRLRKSERALQESDARNSLILKSLPMAFYRATPYGEYGVTWVSEQIDQIAGFSPEDMVDPDFWSSRLHPDDRDMVLKAFEGLVETKTLEIEYRWHRADGEYIWVQDSAVLLQDDAGDPQEIIGTWTDISARKRDSLELSASEERYRSLVENLPLPFIIHSDEKVVYANPASATVLGGTSPEELLGKSLWDFVPPDYKEFYSKRLDVTSGQREPAGIEDGKLKRLSGEVIDIEILGAPIEYKGQEAVQSVFVDITERKQAEQALRASEDRYRTLFDHTEDGISILRKDISIDVNTTWLNMFGLTKDQAIGQTPYDFSPPRQPDGRNSQDKGRELIARALDGESQRFEWEHTRGDGTDFDTEVFLAAIELSGEEVVLAMVRDLTERKQAEAAALEERQRLARDLHDAVSQTLFSASVIAQTLERSWDHNPELVQENLKELHILTQGALAEMRTLLYELRPAALEHTLMTDLLKQLVDGFSGRTKAGIDLSITAEHPLPYEVRMTLFRLGQAALSNIIKHARAEHVKVYYDSQPGEVRLIIEDDGRGFDPANVEVGHHGLEIMRERAGAINADLIIESQPGKGTKIEVLWQEK